MSATERKLLIVDDEAPARSRLESLVSELPGWSALGSCASGAEAIARIERERPAVVLLDIRMPAMSGIEVARHLCLLDSPPAVIFTTAYDEYAVAYRDRTAIGSPPANARNFGESTMLGPSIMIDGELVGSWKRSVSKARVEIVLMPWRKLTTRERAAAEGAAERHAAFLGLPCRIQ